MNAQSKPEGNVSEKEKELLELCKAHGFTPPSGAETFGDGEFLKNFAQFILAVFPVIAPYLKPVTSAV